MPATPWTDIPKGQRCTMLRCHHYATHFYAGRWMCCACHTGEPDGGLVSNDVAVAYHEGRGDILLLDDEEGVVL